MVSVCFPWRSARWNCSPRRVSRDHSTRRGARASFALSAPAKLWPVWGRVAGDALDLVALGAAARKSPRNRTVWGSLAFVAAATALDVFVAGGLDRTTGKMSPARIRGA